MKKVLLGTKKNFYKANMHCHSNISDGKYSPEELKDMYKEKGYSILAITDHEKIINHSYLDDEDFLTITSGEYAIKQFPEQSTLSNRKMKVCHINLYAKEQNNDNSVCYSYDLDHFNKDENDRIRLRDTYGDYERRYGSDGINEIIDIANKNGFFVCYNHPRWSLENYSDYSGYEGLWAVEVYNSASTFEGIYETDINVFDDFLRDGKKICASCGDDNHFDNERFKAFVMVNTDKLTYSNVIDALLNGDFYSSTGPEIYELSVEENKVKIKCSFVKDIALSTEGRRAKRKYNTDGTLINEAEFEICPEDGYFRLDLCDQFGNHAWTQAYFIDEL